MFAVVWCINDGFIIRKVLSVKKLLDAQNNTFGEESEQTTKLNFKKNSVDDAWTAHTRCESGVQRGELTLLANGVALLSFNLFILAGQIFPNNKAEIGVERILMSF